VPVVRAAITTPCPQVDVPPLSVWRDEASNASVVLTYETAYGESPPARACLTSSTAPPTRPRARGLGTRHHTAPKRNANADGSAALAASRARLVAPLNGSAPGATALATGY
jgi:hypothetical protein